MPVSEQNNRVPIGKRSQIEFSGVPLVKENQNQHGESWINRLFRLDFSNFVQGISNSLSFNNATRTLFSTINGVTATSILPTWNEIKDLTIAQEIANTTTTFANITGLGVNLVAGAVYEIEVAVIYNTALATTGINLSFAGSVAPTIYANNISIPTSTVAVNTRNYATPNSETPSTSSARLNNNYAKMNIVFSTPTLGTYYPRFASEIAGSGITIKRGSFIKVRRLT